MVSGLDAKRCVRVVMRERTWGRELEWRSGVGKLSSGLWRGSEAVSIVMVRRGGSAG